MIIIRNWIEGRVTWGHYTYWFPKCENIKFVHFFILRFEAKITQKWQKRYFRPFEAIWSQTFTCGGFRASKLLQKRLILWQHLFEKRWKIYQNFFENFGNRFRKSIGFYCVLGNYFSKKRKIFRKWCLLRRIRKSFGPKSYKADPPPTLRKNGKRKSGRKILLPTPFSMDCTRKPCNLGACLWFINKFLSFYKNFSKSFGDFLKSAPSTRKVSKINKWGLL